MTEGYGIVIVIAFTAGLLAWWFDRKGRVSK